MVLYYASAYITESIILSVGCKIFDSCSKLTCVKFLYKKIFSALHDNDINSLSETRAHKQILDQILPDFALRLHLPRFSLAPLPYLEDSTPLRLFNSSFPRSCLHLQVKLSKINSSTFQPSDVRHL